MNVKLEIRLGREFHTGKSILAAVGFHIFNQRSYPFLGVGSSTFYNFPKKIIRPVYNLWENYGINCKKNLSSKTFFQNYLKKM